MILFCDTSALVKFYLQEDGSTELLALAESASAIAVCRIAWVEAMAAFARRSREVPSDAGMIEEARQRCKNHWPSFVVVDVSQSLVELAGEYAETFALRGYDSVQLAAGKMLVAHAGEPVYFACFDNRLVKAARVLGMETA